MVQNKLEKQMKIMGTHHGHRAISNNENSLKCFFFFSMFIGKETDKKVQGKKKKKSNNKSVFLWRNK